MKKGAKYPRTINMNRFLFLFVSLCFVAGDVLAQSQSDSLKAVYADTSWQFEDTLNQRTVVVTFENEKLTTIHTRKWLSCGGTEHVTFYLLNDSLVTLKYKVSDPDIRSSSPPSMGYYLYFKMDKQVGQDTAFPSFGLGTCAGFFSVDKDFIKEFYYYKDLIYSDEK